MPSPTFPISSCLTGAIANSPRSSPSSASSALSESSNPTPLFISTKRNRAPRKRPNQCSAEAAALLSTIYPKLFSATNLQLSTFRLQQPPDDPFPVLLPSFPFPDDAGLVLPNLGSPPKSPVQLSQRKSLHAAIDGPAGVLLQDPGSPDLNPESILDEEVEEGIDSIMGNLSMVKESNGGGLASLMGFGFGFGISSNIRGALRKSDDAEWWGWRTVAVMDIAPNPSVIPGNAAATASKKKKKKKKKRLEKEEGKERGAGAPVASPENVVLKEKLGLKLNYEGIISEWSGGSPFSGEIEFPESAADIIVRVEKQF